VNADGEQRYFFDRKPFVHPAIIEDLSANVNDEGDQVVAINIDDSNNSNRYFGNFDVVETEHENLQMYHNSGNPYVVLRRKDVCSKKHPVNAPVIGYDLIGKIDQVYVIHSSESTCGMGVWHRLLFLTLESDCGLVYESGDSAIRCQRKRSIVRKLGEIPLGDRYEGFVTIDSDKIVIKADKRKSAIHKEDVSIRLVP